MLYVKPVEATFARRHNLKTPCYVGSVAMWSNELYVQSIAQLPYLSIIPAHYV
ncbi:MAG TPA: hypothetical protein VHL11_19215 [Phototrophicaceae bacterium]|nr:hypothetical protein [Phototrophicaceae bacterium]